VKRYAYLVSRGWTEKEKVMRRRRALELNIEDNYADKVTFGEAIENIESFLKREVPPSIFKSL